MTFAAGFVTWNEADANGVAGAQLSIDGQSLGKSSIYGPDAAASGVNFAGVFGTLAPGTHTLRDHRHRQAGRHLATIRTLYRAGTRPPDPAAASTAEIARTANQAPSARLES